MRSTMAHQFSQVPSVAIQRSKFRRDHGLKTTMDSGILYPVYWDEVLPGDTHTVRMNAFGRMASAIHPIMDNIFLDTFFFFVPNRLLWDNWEKFCGYQENPGDSTDYLVPIMQSPAGGYAEGSIHDYFGLPTKVAGLEHISLYHRAYNQCWNDWFRDENIQDSVTEHTGDSQDPDTDYVLLRRGKRHDYFTSCLPWPQKDNGNPVLLPLGSQAPVQGIGMAEGAAFAVDGNTRYDTANPTGRTYAYSRDGGTQQFFIEASGTGQGDAAVYADLSQATAATINDLRQAFQVQRMYEKDARGGTRYVEILKTHFQVVSPDFRLQRPEYLGGGSTMVNIHPVTQTSASSSDIATADTPQGNLAAFGTLGVKGHGFTKSFVEHGVIIGMAAIRADLTYQQGLCRSMTRRTRFDYFWPSLANLGEMAVLNKEIYAQGSADPTADEAVFGYQEHWADYRYKQSRITGLFRSNATQSLDPWHLSQEFGNLPVLTSQAFIEDNPPIDRVIAVTDQPQFILDAFFNVVSARPMPVNSVPGLIDHF